MRRAFSYMLLAMMFLAIGAAANAQTRGDFEPIEKGFKLSRALEKDGTKVLLILYPLEFLGDNEVFDKGTLTVLPIVFGCDLFPDCKPVLIKAKDKDGKGFAFVSLPNSELKIIIRGLGLDRVTLVGVHIEIGEVEIVKVPELKT